MNRVSLASLRQEDSSWDYRGEFTKRLTHGFHSYPAMMIPQVARRLIETYSAGGQTVLDPFCGLGSVLVEARVLGRKSWGIDLNPLALLVSRVKTTPVDPDVLRREYARLQERIGALEGSRIRPPDFFNRDYWFKPAVAEQLARIKAAIDEPGASQAEAVGNFFLVAFSDTVRLSSNSRSREFKLFRYGPRELESYAPDAIGIFGERVERNIRGMEEFYLACRPDGDLPWCRPFLGDSTRGAGAIPEGSVDLVVTSPPYGDSRTTVAYGQFSRLSAQWLGLEDREARRLDARLMGGRTAGSLSETPPSPSLRAVVHRVAKADSARARQVLGFYLDLEAALGNLARLVRPGGYVCIVIGNRRVKGIELPTDLITAEMGATVGLGLQRIVVRSIPSKKMPLRNSPTNVPGEQDMTMHKEYIVVLRKAR